MGSNRRYLTRNIPTWAATLGLMKQYGSDVEVTCTKCGWTKPFDLDAAIAKLGPDYCLWDKRPPCRQPGCDYKVLFMVAATPRAPRIPCIT